jgi:hypothetical protein
MLMLDVCQNIWFLLLWITALEPFQYGVYYRSTWNSCSETRKRTENRSADFICLGYQLRISFSITYATWCSKSSRASHILTGFVVWRQNNPERASVVHLSFSFHICVSVHHQSIILINQLDATLCSLIYSLLRFTVHVSGTFCTHHQEYN